MFCENPGAPSRHDLLRECASGRRSTGAAIARVVFTTMLLIFPVFFFAILAKTFVASGVSVRPAVLRAAILTGVATAISTEALSAGWARTPGGIGATWLCAAGAALYYRSSRAGNMPLRSLMASPVRWRGVHVLYALPALVLVGLVAVNAVLSPSHIPDVLFYHLPRIRFWLQNQTVAFYPAQYAPQLYMPPWATERNG